MPLRIRCPHCHKTLLAEDETVGQRKLCPACGEVIDVPLPVEEVAEGPADVGTKCPRCGAGVAPGTSACRKCHTNIVTGQRLPLPQRLPGPHRTGAGGGLVWEDEAV